MHVQQMSFLMTFKWLRRQLSSSINEACPCPINVFFDCKMGSKKGYMEMSKKIYLEVIILVPSRSISHYSLRKPENRDPSGLYINPTCCKNVLHKQHGQLGFHFLMFFLKT